MDDYLSGIAPLGPPACKQFFSSCRFLEPVRSALSREPSSGNPLYLLDLPLILFSQILTAISLSSGTRRQLRLEDDSEET